MASRKARISLFMTNKALLERILMHEVDTLVQSSHYSISSMLGDKFAASESG